MKLPPLRNVMLELVRRLLNIAIGFDQLAWVILTLGNGHPDETISAASWRMERDGKLAGKLLRPAIDLLFRPLEKDHCYLSWRSEVNRTHLPKGYESK